MERAEEPAAAGGTAPTCRICLDEGGDDLISPCACTGTQAYVHLRCLQRWRSSPSQARQDICPVCRYPYTLGGGSLPPPPRPRTPKSALHRRLPRRIADFADRHPFILVALAVLLSFWRRPEVFLLPTVVIVLFSLCLAHGAQGLFGVRLDLGVDDAGMPLLRLIRYGAPIRGLAAGTLLVSTDTIGGGIFHRTVILLSRYEPGAGADGFILNLPYPPAAGTAPLEHALRVDADPSAVMHCVGGPVATGDWNLLHHYDDVRGATPIGGGLHLNGDLAEIRRRAEAGAQAAAGGGGGGRPAVQALYGHAAWAGGQLEGEVRAGAWRWVPDAGRAFAFEPDPRSSWQRATALALVRLDIERERERAEALGMGLPGE